ncbi:MAG: L-2-amino-thiazoline-4-carboxylic acid hydrolase [Candidatus Thorarchaeota archaeon]
MKFYRVGEFKENVLDGTVDINPKEQASQFVLTRLNYLLGFLRERSPDNIDAFTKNLEKRYQKLTKTDYIKENSVDLSELVTDFENLADYTSLMNAAMNYYFQVLDFAAESKWDEDIVVVNRNYHQAFLHPRYYNLLTLIETVGREEAISLWKRFFTEFVIYDRVPREKPFVDLETFLAERTAAVDEDNPSDWVVVRGMIADGKYAFRNDNCFWVESLDDLPDSEIKYYVCCYGDYEGARDHHESIVLTMEHTIAQGDPYCSRVMHDTRVDYDLRHPPKEFWDEMWPVESKKKSS